MPATVLMLGWEFPPRISGGLGTACAGLVRGLARAGVEILFVLPRRAGGEDQSDARVVGCDELQRASDAESPRAVIVDSSLTPYLRAGDYRTRRGEPYGADLFAEVERYARIVEEHATHASIELVHAHDWMTFPAGIAAARRAGVPLVAHVHSSEYDRSGVRVDPRIVAIEQRGLDAADIVVAVSNYTARVLRERYRVDPRKLRVVHNAVAHERVLALRAEKQIDEPLVLFLGRFTFQKGPEHFLRAARRVVDELPRVKFVMAGDGDLWPQIVELAASLGLARHVHFTGFLDARDVERIYAMADVYVMPSVSEPFGIAPLEALALDTPVIVSRQSGVAEVLDSALVVDFWDVEQMALQILTLLKHPWLAEELATLGRAEVGAMHWDARARAVRELYAEIVR